ncbi:MAG: 50S ribosomal protein L1 [Spirochaetia bacterium]|nr:50S ribosomal protein L1 [Spirochaetia bacterium]
MAKKGKKYIESVKKVEKNKEYNLIDGIGVIKDTNYTKFDASLEGHFNIKYKSIQNVRGVINLPHGTGKKVRILVFAKGEKAEEAKKAGADYVGDNDYIKKIQEGWMDFDVVVSTPDVMKDVGKLGAILGKKGLMPKPKAGTVTNDVTAIVKQLRAGRIEYKADKTGVIHVGLGKLSFDDNKLHENVMTAFNGIVKDKPTDAKGEYVVGMYIAGTMSPSVKIDIKELRK